MPSTTYNTHGTHVFNVPAGVTSLQVEIWGAGGNGGGTGAGGSGGGGGGAYTINTAYVVVPGNNYNAVVGVSGGTQGTSATPGTADSYFDVSTVNYSEGGATSISNTGSPGGSTFGSGATASNKGGSGGTSSSTGGSGGGGAGGDGSAGTNGTSSSSSTGGGGGAGGTIGAGSSAGGAGGAGGGNGSGGSGGLSPGAGGGGAGSGSSSGGTGSDGQITITWTAPPPDAPVNVIGTFRLQPPPQGAFLQFFRRDTESNQQAEQPNPPATSGKLFVALAPRASIMGLFGNADGASPGLVEAPPNTIGRFQPTLPPRAAFRALIANDASAPLGTQPETNPNTIGKFKPVNLPPAALAVYFQNIDHDATGSAPTQPETNPNNLARFAPCFSPRAALLILETNPATDIQFADGPDPGRTPNRAYRFYLAPLAAIAGYQVQGGCDQSVPPQPETNPNSLARFAPTMPPRAAFVWLTQSINDFAPPPPLPDVPAIFVSPPRKQLFNCFRFSTPAMDDQPTDNSTSFVVRGFRPTWPPRAAFDLLWGNAAGDSPFIPPIGLLVKFLDGNAANIVGLDGHSAQAMIDLLDGKAITIVFRDPSV